jgi:hypothetical protein
MTAIRSVPFYEQNFQFARVALDATGRHCVSIFYQVLSVCSWAFSQYSYEYYAALASYQRLCAECYWLAYTKFGKDLVDFCLNTPSHLPICENGIEALKTLYGQTIEHWSKIGTFDIPLKQDLLQPKEVAQDGCCAGISLDAIVHYLHDIECGLTFDTAIRNLCGRYSNGAPSSAEVAQIFLEALQSDDKETVLGEIKQDFLRKLSDLYEKTLRAMEATSDETRKSILWINYKIKLLQLREQCYSELVTSAAHFGFQKLRLIAEKMGLSLQIQDQFLHAKSKASSSELDLLIRNLPIGVYFISLRSHEGTHAIAYFKIDEKTHFALEPNFGIVKSQDSSVDLLRGRISENCPEKSVYLVSFYRCALQ